MNAPPRITPVRKGEERPGDSWRIVLACGHYGPVLREGDRMLTRTFCQRCHTQATVEALRETRGSVRRRTTNG